MKHPNSEGNLRRREFLRLAGLLVGALSVTAFLDACQRIGMQPNLDPTATSTQNPPGISPILYCWANRAC